MLPGAGPCERLLRLATEHSLLRLHKRLADRMCKSAAQRYLEFRRQYPGLDLRIPQYHIAGYLGVSAEFLSRLRARIRTTRNGRQ